MPDEKKAQVYTAETILRKRIQKGKTQYLIKWKGWATKWNTWEPEKHILDKLLIEDFNDRTRKRSKSKSLRRPSVSTSSVNRTRRLASSSSSSAENDEPSPKAVEHERSDAYKLRPKKADVEMREESPSEDDRDSPPVESKPKFDESIREFLWKPKMDLSSDTTITEVTDQTGVTVLIREVSDACSLATPRFLGYGHAGRGVRH